MGIWITEFNEDGKCIGYLNQSNVCSVTYAVKPGVAGSSAPKVGAKAHLVDGRSTWVIPPKITGINDETRKQVAAQIHSLLRLVGVPSGSPATVELG